MSLDSLNGTKVEVEERAEVALLTRNIKIQVRGLCVGWTELLCVCSVGSVCTPECGR